MSSTPVAEKANILLVDDTPNNLRLLTSILKGEKYDVRRAINGMTALMGVKASKPDLILLDINMPDMTGYEVCEALKQDVSTAEIPIIFISALDEAIDKVKAFQVGGVDYITKPFEVTEVLVRIETQLALRSTQLQLQRMNQSLELRVQERTEVLEEEMARRREVQNQLFHLANHDVLTGLPNRVWLMKQVEQCIAEAQSNHVSQSQESALLDDGGSGAIDVRASQANIDSPHDPHNSPASQPELSFAVLLLSCNRFKLINDSFGHDVGDQLLLAIAQRFEQVCLAHGCLLTRWSGEEFAILMESVYSVPEVTMLVNALRQAMLAPLIFEQHEVIIGISAGIALGHAQYEQPEHVLRDADTALFQVQATHRDIYQIFHAKMREQAVLSLQLESDLRRALAEHQLSLNYQPIVLLGSEQIIGFEALVRWNHPERGWISPAEFIPVAEATGLIIPLGMWVLREACFQLKRWQRCFPLNISVNLSTKQFAQSDLIKTIDQILSASGVDGRFLKLEITESAVMDNAEHATQILAALKARQIQLAIDDFGTGYSSLGYLHRFPVDTLKMDRSFVQWLDEGDGAELASSSNLEIIKATVNIAHALGMNVVAEGIETNQQQQLLTALGCEFGQGYWFSRPLTTEQVETMLASVSEERLLCLS